MNSIVEAVLSHARRQPERLVLFFEGRSISYGDLAEEVQRFARAAVAWGLHTGDRVALFLENCSEFAVAYLGTQLAGGIVVLVNTQYRQVELSHILADLGRAPMCDKRGGCERIGASGYSRA